MSNRAWQARRHRRIPGFARWHRQTRQLDLRDLRTDSRCPYWRHVALGEPSSACTFGCWEEPRCLWLGPPDRWPRRLLRSARKAGVLRTSPNLPWSHL